MVEAHLRTLHVAPVAVDAGPPSAAPCQGKRKWNKCRSSVEVVAWGPETNLRKCASFYYLKKGDDDYMAVV
ncbi:hypothetical protein SCLCIDRAFT_1221951 [Scleroderma citrinum Foug A]|uniref:Uncharacterized protein n=1 Tax=Scleroderma citrinum Foug A TaxID=1036808 RepID=A0A0C3DDI3_9AGAM|nr:hypothetical protein SCLCIDRAFT_1221951 [Scleroderma citrinum Foug A]